MTDGTIFDRILSGDIPCNELYSDERCLAFRDIEPQAPIHFLVIPRINISSLREIEDKDQELLGHLLLVSAKVAQSQGLSDWRTIINTGAKAGQTVFHLHIHVIGGRKLNWPPG